MFTRDFFFVVITFRAALMKAGCSAAEGSDRDTTRMWALPPVVPFGLLMQRLEAWLRRLLRDAQSASREEVGKRRVGGWVGG